MDFLANLFIEGSGFVMSYAVVLFIAGMILDLFEGKHGRGVVGCAFSAVISSIGILAVDLLFYYLIGNDYIGWICKFAVIWICFNLRNFMEFLVFLLSMFIVYSIT